MYRTRKVWPPGRSRPLAAGAATALVLSLLALAGEVPALGEAAAGQPAAAAKGSDRESDKGSDKKSSRITLLTGDTVTFTDGKDPRVHIEQAEREGRGDVVFRTGPRGRGFYVIPSDAQRYVQAGTLDRELFNVRSLARQGLTDPRTSALPLIVTYGKGVRASAEELPATRGKDRPLPSVNGAAVEVTRAKAADFWHALHRPGARTLAGQVKKVWLDQRLKPVLDKSVPQIGAPEAWKAGYDGKGVDVAVLDTGIDANHPDVKDRIAEAKSFLEGDADPADAHGHGTHVASTIAGTGAASGGKFKGVAPGARLHAGKVCDAGGCPESAILEGMDWAAKSGAKVVNMSLGGAPTDGTDLLSQRVNQLTEETGALFVIAAGNDGHNLTVGSPGSADAALTVGAVDKDDKLASFSSRGPRWGDAAVKPEITAPGVGINAARAEGMLPDYPGDGEGYVRMSGTSMATPHVAGSAALLAQSRPELKASELKNALASTAKDSGRAWHEQGAGRLDVPAALKPVTGPASLSMGRLAHDARPATREVTYTNRGDTDVTLKLDLSQRGWDGRAGEAATLKESELTVPAKGSATAHVTVDPAKADQGVYGGAVTAAADGVALRTPVSWYRAPQPEPKKPLTIKLTGSDGKPLADSHPYVYAQLDGSDVPANDPLDQVTDQVDVEQSAPGVYTAQVPADGRYMVYGSENTNAPDKLRTTVLAATGVKPGSPVTLDAHKAVRVQARTPDPVYRYNHAMSVHVGSLTGIVSTHSTGRAQGAELWALPAAGPAKGKFAVQETYTLGEKTVTATARLGGKKVDLRPEYEPVQAARLPGRHALPVVYSGAGTADDFAKVDVKGKAALVKIPFEPSDENLPWSYKAAKAAEAAAKLAKDKGAAAILPYLDSPNARPLVPLSTGPRAVALPYLGIRQTHGEQLRAQARPVLDLSVKANPGYMYNLHYAPPLSAGVPKNLTHVVDPARLKKTTTGYHSEVRGLMGYAWTFAFEKDRAGTYQGASVYFDAPAKIDQYYGGITGKQRWSRSASLTDGSNQYFQRDWVPWRGAKESFFAGPTTIVAPDVDELAGVSRFPLGGSTQVLFASPYLGDSAPGHFINVDAGIVYPFGYKLFRDGKEIPARHSPGFSTPYFELPPDKGEYRMEGTFTLPSSGPYAPNDKVKTYAPKTENVWTFTSEPATGPQCGTGTDLTVCNVPPLLQLRYDLGLDLTNRAKAGGSHRIAVRAYPARHSSGGGEVKELDLSYSLDAGKSWRKAKVTPGGKGRFTASLDHAAAKGTAVWLRTEARSDSGATLKQTVQRAYDLR
ncbi:S8 family serine peptidase [Streptomyces boninensis]|uniref:S8 family serine peptidase n=1 Tax=Streptomyces boninensis TaxID=2039455 RepID=UPI003B227A30